MLEGPPPKRALQQAATILRFEVVELEKAATMNLERAAAGEQDVMAEYVRHASLLERQAGSLRAVARWLENQARADRRAAPDPARPDRLARAELAELADG